MRNSARKIWWGALVAVLTVGVMAFGAVNAQSMNEPKKKMSWTIGVGSPSGSGVSDYYGSTWLNIKGNYRLAQCEKNEQSISFGLCGGNKSKDFMWGPVHPESEADYSATIFSLAYDYKIKTASSFYYGAGVGIHFARTSAKYDAGEGWTWPSNDNRYIEMSKSGTTIAPSFGVGYQIKETIGMELGYTMFNTTLAGNTSSVSGLPPVPATKLSGLLTFSANVRF